MKKIALILLDKEKKSQATLHTLTELNSSSAKYTIFPADELGGLVEKNFDTLILLADVPESAPVIKAFHSASKPIGAFDQGVPLIAKVLGSHGVTLAVEEGADSKLLTSTGSFSETCALDDFVTDRENKVVSTHGDLIGIRRALTELIEMA